MKTRAKRISIALVLCGGALLWFAFVFLWPRTLAITLLKLPGVLHAQQTIAIVRITNWTFRTVAIPTRLDRATDSSLYKLDRVGINIIDRDPKWRSIFQDSVGVMGLYRLKPGRTADFEVDLSPLLRDVSLNIARDDGEVGTATIRAHPLIAGSSSPGFQVLVRANPQEQQKHIPPS